MRFADKKLSVNAVAKLIETANELGIDTHHSSCEYSSYELYSEALKRTNCKKSIKHIVKLSSPHFEESKFSLERLEAKLDQELRVLGVEQVEVLQWLVRSKPINDADRLATLNDQNFEISEALNVLKSKGKIRSVFSFPYSVNFAEEVLKMPEIDGLVTYLNHEELAYKPYAESVPFIAIRPFFAGKLLDSLGVESCLEFTSKHSHVISTIVGINSLNHLEDYKKFV